MSEKTVEENLDLTFGWESCPKHSCVLRPPNSSECFICDEIRAAEAAERERCAEIHPLSVDCDCGAKAPDGWCRDAENRTCLPHYSRWRAAIRKELT